MIVRLRRLVLFRSQKSAYKLGMVDKEAERRAHQFEAINSQICHVVYFVFELVDTLRFVHPTCSYFSIKNYKGIPQVERSLGCRS